MAANRTLCRETLCCAVLKYYVLQYPAALRGGQFSVRKMCGRNVEKKLVARPSPLPSSQRASPDLPIDPPARTQIGTLIYAEQKQMLLRSPTGVQTSVPLSDRVMITQVNKKHYKHMETTTRDDAFKNGTRLLSERLVKCALAQRKAKRSACV